jgi:hypothetical protein
MFQYGRENEQCPTWKSTPSQHDLFLFHWSCLCWTTIVEVITNLERANETSYLSKKDSKYMHYHFYICKNWTDFTIHCSVFPFLYNVKESSKITTLPMKRRSWDSSFCFGITQLHLGMGTFHNQVLFICCLFKYFGWTVWIYSICWRSFIISMCSIKQDFISNSLLVIR